MRPHLDAALEYFDEAPPIQPGKRAGTRQLIFLSSSGQAARGC
jgi:hypothetical protein